MLVRKFGGTSVKDASAVKRTVGIVLSSSEKQIVVVSALAGITNLLVSISDSIRKHQLEFAITSLEEVRNRHITLVNELNVGDVALNFVNQICDELQRIIIALDVIGEVSAKSFDKILSVGEVLSSFIISEYAGSINNKVCHLDSRSVIKTDSSFMEAEVDFEITSEKINSSMSNLNNYDVFICGGFIGSDKFDSTTTLGRGGSDYSAAVYAKCINASKLEIWTDVDGILTSDPRLINNALLLKEVSYKEAAELAYFGAKVLHPKTIFPAIQDEIPVYVLNSYKPEGAGTLIRKDSEFGNIIKAIAFRKNITVINISSNRMLGAYGFLAKVFDVFLKNETSVDLVTTSEVSISLTIENDKNLQEIIHDLGEFASIEIYRKRAIISAVGEGIRDTSGIASRFFRALDGVNILMISMGASEVNLSIIVDDSELNKAVELLHKEFFETDIENRLFVKLN